MATRRSKNTKPAKTAPSASKGRSVQPAAKAAQKATPSQPDDPRVGQVQRLIDLMVERGAVEIELADGDAKVRIRLREDRPAGVVHYSPPPHSMSAPGAPLAPHATAAAHSAAPVEGDVFLSPMVGTFYRSPSPDAEPFVEVGDRIEAEKPLCIIEAMKVMNEIKAEFAAEITALLVENGQTVEFGQPLFRLKRL